MCKHCLQGRCPVCQGKHFAWGALEAPTRSPPYPPPGDSALGCPGLFRCGEWFLREVRVMLELYVLLRRILETVCVVRLSGV